MILLWNQQPGRQLMVTHIQSPEDPPPHTHTLSLSSCNWSSAVALHEVETPPCGAQQKRGHRGWFKSPGWGGASHRPEELYTGKSLPPTTVDDLKLGETAKMATQPQQPPQLHLAELTAAQFIDIWKHFDVDGQCAQVSACLMTVELAIGSICVYY